MEVTTEQLEKYSSLLDDLDAGLITIDELNEWLDNQGGLGNAIPEQFVNLFFQGLENET